MAFRTIDTDCPTHKASYPTSVDAGEAAEWATRRHLGPRFPYACSHGDHWHVTSRDPALPAHIDHHRTDANA